MKRGLAFGRGVHGSPSVSGSLDSGWLSAAAQGTAPDPVEVAQAESAEATVADALASQESTPAAEAGPRRDAGSLRWRVVAALALFALALQSLALWWALPASDPATRGYVETRLSSVVTTLAGAESSIEQLRSQLNEVAARPLDAEPPTVAAADAQEEPTLALATSDADQPAATLREVVITPGDTATAIARRAGVSLAALAETNNTTIERLSLIRAGTVLLVPLGAAD